MANIFLYQEGIEKNRESEKMSQHIRKLWKEKLENKYSKISIFPKGFLLF